MVIQRVYAGFTWEEKIRYPIFYRHSYSGGI